MNVRFGRSAPVVFVVERPLPFPLTGLGLPTQALQDQSHSCRVDVDVDVLDDVVVGVVVLGRVVVLDLSVVSREGEGV